MHRVLSLLILFSSSSLVAAQDTSAEQKARQQVQGFLSKMAAAELKGDHAMLAQGYESDGLLLPSSGEPVKGRDDIAKRYQAIFAGSTPRSPLDSEELWILGDLAVSRGVTREPAPRRNVKGAVKNRYVMTLKRHGEGWEIHTLVWTAALSVK